MTFSSYIFRLAVAGSVCHVIAICCTVFRLLYRGWTRHLWWEDAWAAIALISDVMCLVWMWMHDASRTLPPSTFAVAFTSVVWAARMSIIFSIIRIAKFSGHKYQKWITYFITISFGCMWAAVLIQKIHTCIYACQMTESVAILQMTTDVVADLCLIVVPLQFWKNLSLSRNSKIMIISAFASSLFITVITIPHSIMLFRSASETTLIIAHVKAALSLVVCNLLVIVTLVYRVRWKETLYPDETFGSTIVFTSVIAAQTTANAISMTSSSMHEEPAQDNS
ncbi:hypothetical protein P692DRAFT_20833711 [Suillus brevipes Sb2]|nr:hypothetical protein P692DRAFT_20833711 [Suillus brevipes Sb2]